MFLRLTLGSLLLMSVAPAQQKAQDPVKPPAVNPGDGPVRADAQQPAPQQPAPLTPAQQAEQLNKEKQRLQQEIDYTKQRATDAKALINQKLAQRKPTFKTIDAGTSSLSAPAPMAARRSMRVMTPDELASQPADVMLLVDGQPVMRSAYDSLMEYLAKAPNPLDENLRSQRAMFELIRTQAVASAFPNNEAAGQIADVYGAIEGGKSVADLAAAVGTLPGAAEGGRVEITHNSIFGTMVEQMAFTTPVGSHSKPFLTTKGFAVVGVDSVEKGATPDLDKVIAHVLQVSYVGPDGALQKAEMTANSGQVEIVVRDEKVAELLPALFRSVPAARPTTPGVAPVGELADQDIANLHKRLEALETEIAVAEKGETPDKTQLERLRAEHQKLKMLLARAQRPGAVEMPKDVTPGTKPVHMPVKDVPQKPKGQ